MSLINDALKRAQEAQRPNPVSSAASIRTIEPRQPERPLISRLLVVVIFVLLSAAFAFVGLAMTGRLAKKAAATPQAAPAIPVAAATTPSKLVAAPAPTVVPAPIAVAPAAASEPVPPPAPKPVPVVAAPAVVPPPPPLVLPESLHVQGVAYDPVRPWAIVSGRTVYVGDLVKGVRVIAINANSVTFGSNGQTNLLFVGD